MTKEALFERIEQYIRGELDEAGRQAFEQELERDPLLVQEVDRHREIHQAIGNRELQQFSDLIRERGQLYFEREASQMAPVWQKYRMAAAAAALLLVAGLGYWFFTRPADPQALFAEYYEPYHAPGNFRSEDIADLEDNFLLGLARYDEGQYAEAAQYFTQFLEKKPDRDLAVFLRGLSYLAIDSLAQAVADLRAVAADEESLFRDQGYWYLGLLYLRQAESSKARNVLHSAAPNERINELLKKLPK